MALTKYKLGDLIKQHNERCANRSVNGSDISGVNRDKEFFPSRQVGSDVSNYKVVPAGYFACNLMHVGRDIVLPIAYNRSNHEVYVSPAYTVFCIKKDAPIDAIYLEMWFKSDERDRYFWMHTDSSIRDGMTYDDMCDIDIDLPSIEIQKKYVDIYKSMLDNQKCYERGLDDLKLTCEAYIENLKKTAPLKELRGFVTEKNTRNAFGIKNVLGISKEGFINPKQDVGDLEKYKVFTYNSFVYSPPRINVGSIGLYKQNDSAVCSPIYVVFEVSNTDIINPDYLMILFKRDEFLRATDYYSLASVRNNFSFDSLCDMEFPIPDIKTQNAIANIFLAYQDRTAISRGLKQRISELCPILIKGSLEEANK